VKELPGLNEINSQPIKRGRSKNFSVEEDLMLVSAYLNVSKDPITGRYKKEGTFWEIVWKYFNKNRKFESDRNWSSLKHRWLAIQKEVNIFQGYYDAIERKDQSGKTSDDKVNHTYGTIFYSSYYTMYSWSYVLIMCSFLAC
jgi:hypothetical protein